MAINQSTLRRQEGSITVMVALLLPIMLMMLVLIININYLIVQKIRLQNVVDACVLSAAAVQAAGLNEIADLNRDMMAESDKIRNFLGGQAWYNRRNAQNAKNYFYNGSNGVIDFIYSYQMEANRDYASMAHQAALKVQEQNFPQAHLESPGNNTGQLADFYKKPKFYRYTYYTRMDASASASPRPTRRWEYPARNNPRYAGDHNGVSTLYAKRRAPLSSFFSVPYRLEKRTTVMTAYEIMLPAHDFPWASTFFRGAPVLKARAAAKPAGGYISTGIPEYQALLIK